MLRVNETLVGNLFSVGSHVNVLSATAKCVWLGAPFTDEVER